MNKHTSNQNQNTHVMYYAWSLGPATFPVCCWGGVIADVSPRTAAYGNCCLPAARAATLPARQKHPTQHHDVNAALYLVQIHGTNKLALVQAVVACRQLLCNTASQQDGQSTEFELVLQQAKHNLSPLLGL